METKVKFGLDQIKSKTPIWATWVFRAVLYVVFIGDLVLFYFGDFVSPETKVLIATLSVKVIGLTHALTRLFGLNVVDPRTNHDIPLKQ